MTTTKSFTKTVLTTLMLLICSALSSAAATFTVSNTDDTGPGSLRQAVLAAHAAEGADTIVFDSAVFRTPRTITLATVVSLSRGGGAIDDVTIIGPGPHLLTISGNNVTRHFQNDAGDTTSISGMTLTGGNAGGGGAILNEGRLTLTNVDFTQNTSNTGGAIFTSGNGTTTGVLNISGCQFTGNTTTGTNINGNGGSALLVISGNVTITDSIMTGGTTRGGGGAIRVGDGVINISNTTISNNTSGGAGNADGGGGIYSNGEMTLTNCIVSGNTAGEGTDGGGIRNTLRLTIINSTIDGNTAAGSGGGIFGAGSTASGEFLKITNSTIASNSANAGNGGGIWTQIGMTTTITGSTFSGNSSRYVSGNPAFQGNGGAIYGVGRLTMDNSTVSGNSAAIEGGGIFDPSASPNNQMVITNSTIVNNTAGNTTESSGGVRFTFPSDGDSPTSVGNTIIANNSPERPFSPDPQNYNLIGGDPKLGPLQNNGGPTATHALQPGSPAIDMGKRLSDLTTDQRGVTRPTDDPAIPNASGGDGSDIGAYEIGAFNGVAEKTLGNIATRLPVLTGENVLIGGFIVTGTVPKRVIIRALGPSLGAAGLAGALEDPTLELFQGNTSLVFNNNWKDDPAQASEIAATGVAPSDDREAAIVRTLEPGNYTAIVRSNTGATGIGLVDSYDLDQRPDSKLANIATRGFVSTGDDVLIAGFIAGPSTRVAVRAIGPSLAAIGIGGPLQDPTLELVNAQGQIVRANDNWKGIQQAEIESIGIQPSDDRESTLLATLTAGNYTAVVRGKNNTTGVAVVEVYNLE